MTAERSPGVRHETRDVRLRIVVAFVATVLVLGGVELWLVWGFFRATERDVERRAAARYVPAEQPGVELPRDPRLEQLNRLEGREDTTARSLARIDLERLTRFGPTDEAGFVHVPIEDAMTLVVDKLPVRPESPDDDYRARGLVDGGESNSGRMFRGEEK